MGNMKKLPFINMFMKKRRSRGAWWASIAGLGITAALFGVVKGKRKFSSLPLNNMFKNLTPNMDINRMDNAALTEFSEELLESSLNKGKYQ